MLIESVPNFSVGRDQAVLEQIVDCFRQEKGIKLLDYSCDEDHNRAVVSVIGEPEPLEKALFAAVRTAAEEIDLTRHEGAHPRMGATDVLPLIPILGASLDDCDRLARKLGRRIGGELGIPVFLYEHSAATAERQNLATIRKGQFEGMAEKMASGFLADFGPDQPHPTAGVVAVGARPPLIAYNINLGTNRLEVAEAVAKKIRHVGGGLRYVKAMGILLKDRQVAQVSMNLTNFEKTALYQVMEMVRSEASRYGVSVIGSELIGLAPMQAMLETAAFYLQLETFDEKQIIEHHLIHE